MSRKGERRGLIDQSNLNPPDPAPTGRSPDRPRNVSGLSAGPAKPGPGAFTKPARLEDMLLFRMAAATRALSTTITRVLEGHFGITRREWGMLAALAAGPASPSELAQRTVLDRVRISRIMTTLLDKQLIGRTPAATGSGARITLQLTASGRRLQRAVFTEVSTLHIELLQVLDADEVTALAAILDKLQTRGAQLGARPGVERAQRRLGGTRRAWKAGEWRTDGSDEVD